MKVFLSLTLVVFLWVGCSMDDNVPPNIIFFLADDLGYGELGSYGQRKIQTPNLDDLARNGMRFTQHYSGAPVCAPARCVFLTGLHTGHAFIRSNDEWRERGDVWDYAKATNDPNLEGQRPIPESTLTLGKQLQKAGYKTAIIGKWGLGGPLSDGIPNKQGFDYFYGYNCQRQAHNLYPVHLWENLEKDILNNALIPPGTKLDEQADPYAEESYAMFEQTDYAPKKMQEKALAFIKAHKDEPFFLYYATPLPHLPLQVPRPYVNKYRALFGDEQPYIGDSGYFPNRYPRATYAGMISYLDDQLGELIATLKEEGIYNNTLIFFSSDNGPTSSGSVDVEFFDSAHPFSNDRGRIKGFTYEGGIRVPLIAAWPDHIEPGSVSDHISAFYDLMPTLSEIAGLAPPKVTDGISFKATLFNEGIQEQHRFLYWEFPSYQGQQAVRMGKWKGIRKNIFEGNMKIELYDLETDLGETTDVSDQFPNIVHEIEQIMMQEHEPSTNERFKIKQLGDR
jgi:arylsulfatase